MPKGTDWINLLYVNLGFIAQILALYYFGLLADVRKDWAKYRCNPLFMPLSENLEKDFVHCVQTTQSSFMGYILEPIHYIINTLTKTTGSHSDALQDIRKVISNVRTFIESVAKQIFGVFLNIIVEFQKIINNIENLVGRLLGIMVTLMYLLDGSTKTMKSYWNGPPGEMTRDLCFHPSTKVKLANNKIVCMKDISLGDILENGSKVTAVMKIANSDKQDLYVIPKKGVNKGDIYVTANHMMYDEGKKKYVKAKDHPYAKSQELIDEVGKTLFHNPSSIVKSEWFSCLITNDHKIKIGECLFWDWEDDILREKMVK